MLFMKAGKNQEKTENNGKQWKKWVRNEGRDRESIEGLLSRPNSPKDENQELAASHVGLPPSTPELNNQNHEILGKTCSSAVPTSDACHESPELGIHFPAILPVTSGKDVPTHQVSWNSEANNGSYRRSCLKKALSTLKNA